MPAPTAGHIETLARICMRRVRQPPTRAKTDETTMTLNGPQAATLRCTASLPPAPQKATRDPGDTAGVFPAGARERCLISACRLGSGSSAENRRGIMRTHSTVAVGEAPIIEPVETTPWSTGDDILQFLRVAHEIRS